MSNVLAVLTLGVFDVVMVKSGCDVEVKISILSSVSDELRLLVFPSGTFLITVAKVDKGVTWFEKGEFCSNLDRDVED